MDPHVLIAKDALGCNWDTTNFFLFSGNIDSIFIYYSHIFPALACLFLVFLVWPQDRKNPINISFLVLGIAFALWSLLDLIVWATGNIDLMMFLWSLLPILEIIIFAAPLYLIYFFVNKQHPPFKYLFIVFLLVLPIVLLTHTKLNLINFDYTNCERNATEGILMNYLYSLELLATMSVFYFVRNKMFNSTKEILTIATGITLFFLSFSLGNIIGGNTELSWEVGQYGLFGMPIFLGFLVYSMFKYKTFNIRIFRNSIVAITCFAIAFSLLFFY
jgi:hypothetical protein